MSKSAKPKDEQLRPTLNSTLILNEWRDSKLNDMGVYHFWQVAKLTPDEVNAIDNTLKSRGRVAKEDWVGQAKKLQAESEETN